MKSIYSYALLGALAAVGVTSAATTTTTPVGYVSLGDTTSGQPAVKANTDVTVALPLSNAVEYTGTTSAAGSGSTLTVSGTPFTASQYVSTAAPYYLIVTSGAQAGLLGVVTANTTNSITITTSVGTVASVASGDKFVLTKAWTLGTFLPIGTIPNGTQLIAYDGTGVGVNLAATQIYTMTPSGWLTTFGGSGLANSAVVYPGESFILRTGASAVTSLVVTGTVPTWSHRTTIDKLSAVGIAQDNRISYFSPVGELIGSANIPALNGDQFIVFDNTAAGKNKAASAIMTKTPSGWLGTFGVSGIQDTTFKIGGGVGYLYRRAAAGTIGSFDWTDAPSYQATL